MPTIETLRKAVQIAEQIEKLESELKSLLQGGPAPTGPARARAAVSPKPAKKRKGKMSAAGRAAIVAAQKARWAKPREATVDKTAPAKPAKPEKKKRNLSPEVRAKLAAAMKARWEAAKKSGGPAPTAPASK